MRKWLIGAAAVIPTASLLSYWLFSQMVNAVGAAVENMGDLSLTEDWDWDDWDEWDGQR